MISRKSASALGEVISLNYTVSNYMGVVRFVSTELFAFLFERDFDIAFCNAMKRLQSGAQAREFVMRLHTGETIKTIQGVAEESEGRDSGQQLLRQLAEAMLRAWVEGETYRRRDNPPFIEAMQTLVHSLELDGFLFRDGHLLSPDNDVLDAHEEMTVLELLYKSLRLEGQETFNKHLRDSAVRYEHGQWGDAISNARQFFECIMREGAQSIHQQRYNSPVPEHVYKRAFDVREYYEKEGLINEDEKMAIAKFYNLLSNSGNHPNMSEQDQARLLRQLALTMGQFVLLRLEPEMKMKDQ